MTLTVCSTDLVSGHSLPFDALGPVGGLSYSSAWPGGSKVAQWTLDVPPRFSHPAMLPNRLVRIYDTAGCVWSGLLDEPGQGQPWTMSATGMSKTVADYQAVDTYGQPTADPNVALAQAILRGLPVQVPATLPTPTLATSSGATDCAALLNTIGQSAGMRWSVSPHGNLTMTADPTTPSYLYAMPGAFGRTLDGYATHFFASYLDSTSGTVKIVASPTNPGAGITTKFGRIEKTVDLTQLPAMSSAQAVGRLTSAPLLLGQRLNATGTLTVQPGQLRTMGGVPARLASLRAGTGLLLLGASADTALGEVNYTSGVVLPLGEVDYDAASGTAQITPVNALRQDFVGFLTGVAAYA